MGSCFIRISHVPKQIFGSAIFISAFLMATVGCKKNSTEPQLSAQALVIEAAAFNIYAGGSLQMSAKVTYSDGETEDVTDDVQWSVLYGTKGGIDQNGLFSAWGDALGSETIQAFFKGLEAQQEITITARATTLALWPVLLNLQNNGTQQFDLVAQFHDLSAAYVQEGARWSVRPGLAGTISEQGLFRANTGMTGAETLRVTFQNLAVESFVQVSVADEPPFAMSPIPGGAFLMGDDTGLENERPAHNVTLSAFEIGTYEVTNAEYVSYLNEAFRLGEITYSSSVIAAKKGPYAGYIYAAILGSEQYPQQRILFIDRGNGTGEFATIPGFENHPVERMSWYGAMAFCQFYGLRLPTEAEWEMACRGGLQYEYGTATGKLDHDVANYEGYGGADRFISPAPVGSFPANPFGLFDMSGNVSEYVFDAYQVTFYANSPLRNPHGPGPMQVIGSLNGNRAIWRGGAWIHAPEMLRSAFRGNIFHQTDNSQLVQSTIGFRVARSIE